MGMVFCRGCGKEIHETAPVCPACGALQGLPPQQLSVQAASLEGGVYAGFWYRALALFIDTIISVVASLVVVVPLAFAMGAAMSSSYSLSQIEAAGELLGNVLGAVVGWLYFTISESSSWQATPGKKMLGLRVTDEAGNRIGFGRANGRYFSKILSAITLGIGYLMVAFTDKKQGLHDKIAGTLVYKG